MLYVDVVTVSVLETSYPSGVSNIAGPYWSVSVLVKPAGYCFGEPRSIASLELSPTSSSPSTVDESNTAFTARPLLEGTV